MLSSRRRCSYDRQGTDVLGGRDGTRTGFFSAIPQHGGADPRPEAESLRSGNGAAARADLPELLWAALRRKEEKGMDDKNLMENLLMLEKGVCDLYLHGTIESATQKVHTAFHQALNHALHMQDRIYEEMAAKGWYPAEAAEQDKINAVRQKFGAQM